MPRRAVYHLDLDDEKILGARFALLPGDPFRSSLIAEQIAALYGSSASEKPLAHKREYCTYLTNIRGARVLVTSTGIGGPSASIAIDELAQLGVHTFLRVGTTGAIQESIAIGDVVITTGSVRLDGASTDYAPIAYPAVAHPDALVALIAAAKELAGPLGCRYHVGVTVSTDTFYQGQDRLGGFPRYVPRHVRGTIEEWRRLRALNVEMESSTLLTLCGALGLRGGCITGVINIRATEQTDEPITAEHLRLGEEHAIRVGIRAMELLITGPSLLSFGAGLPRSGMPDGGA